MRITNTNEGVIAAAVECCAVLGIGCYVRPRERSARLKLYDVVISRRENIQRLASVVRLRHEEKRRKLEEAAATYRPERPSREALQALYEEHGSQRAVAKALDIPVSTAQLWLREREVVRKPPGRPRQA